MPSYQLVGLPPDEFEPLFLLTDADLKGRGIARHTADSYPGYPCRISLEDAREGEELLLLPFEHHRTESPYRAAGPIYVRRGQSARSLPPGEVPPYVTRRVISLRAYDENGLMLEADVVPGTSVADRLEAMFASDSVAYVHLHNAKQGCYSCLARRVP